MLTSYTARPAEHTPTRPGQNMMVKSAVVLFQHSGGGAFYGVLHCDETSFSYGNLATWGELRDVLVCGT